MDDAVEKLLLELTHDAFSVLRTVCVRVRVARVVYGGRVRTVRRSGAVAVCRLHRRPVGDNEEQQAAQRPAFSAATAHC